MTKTTTQAVALNLMNNCGRSLKNNTPIVGIKQKGGDIKAFATLAQNTIL